MSNWHEHDRRAVKPDYFFRGQLYFCWCGEIETPPGYRVLRNEELNGFEMARDETFEGGWHRP